MLDSVSFVTQTFSSRAFLEKAGDGQGYFRGGNEEIDPNKSNEANIDLQKSDAHNLKKTEEQPKNMRIKSLRQR